MITKKIKLPDGAVEFLSNLIEQKHMSVKDAIVEWNKMQEVQKYLSEGDMVKVRTDPKMDDWHGKKGFIGKVLRPVGTGFEPEKSGKFSVFFFEYDDFHFQGDFIGYELIPTGERVTKDEMIDFMKKIPKHDSMYEELEECTQLIY